MDIASEDFELPREATLLVGGLLGKALACVSFLVSDCESSSSGNQH